MPECSNLGIHFYFVAMKKCIKISRLFLVSLFCLALSVKGISQNTNERGVIRKSDTTIVRGATYAIIIGISNYKNVTPLQYADRDAQAFESFLLSDAGGKVPTVNIETFLNDKGTRTYVGDAISEVARKAKPGDRVYFFFAGHGDMEDLTQIENGLLLLYNSPNGNYFGMNDDVLEILDLKRYLSPLAEHGVEMIFIVDACHSGNLKGGVEGIQQTASALAASWGKEYKILSCQPNQLSLESAEWGGGRGLFSLELEEGMKGLADLNNDGEVNMYELQNYIQTNVAKYSEGRQIPMVTGDLSKPFVKVIPSVLAALKKQKEENYPMLAVINTKGNEEKYVDSLDTFGKNLYASFNKNIADKKLIWPKDTNALRDYRAFEKKYAGNPLMLIMRRNLATSLNERFNKIVRPLLKGETSYSSRDECYYAAMELDSCMNLLGEQHYMYPNLKARKLFMNAMSYTWALNENTYNISMRPTVIKSIQLLEESSELEPNAAYTLSALGILYTFVYEYEKANQVFQKYLDLRPNDISAKYSLGLIYSRLKQYDKAESMFESLLKLYPDDLNIKLELTEVYWQNNKTKKLMAITDQMIASDKTKMEGYFSKGVFFSREINLDSALYYYELTRKYFKGYCSLCDNNIGQIYFVTNHTDSARKYFLQILSHDSTYSFAHFNLGTIELKEGDPEAAIAQFNATIDYSTVSLEGFVTNLQLYFGKTYDTTDAIAYKEFTRQPFMFNMQYGSYLSMLYTYIRVPGFIDSTGKIDFLFNQLFNYKQHQDLTWFHNACYKALKKDKPGALGSLGKSLQLGFGNYFMLTCDNDLALIRDMPEFKALVRKYFPEKSTKNKK
jgi:tetratricopeptide (TPR) repeat protein